MYVPSAPRRARDIATPDMYVCMRAQVTAFVACLAMDANRQEAGRMDWLCCFKSDSRHTELKEEASLLDVRPPMLVNLRRLNSDVLRRAWCLVSTIAYRSLDFISRRRQSVASNIYPSCE